MSNVFNMQQPREIDPTKPTFITSSVHYDHHKKTYTINIAASQDGETIESRSDVVHDNYMSAKIYIDNFYDKYHNATH